MNGSIKDFCEKQKFVQIIRKVAEGHNVISRGYIVDFSNDFVLMQESDDFELKGFNILPAKDFVKIRCSSSDKFYDKIMALENEKQNIGMRAKLDLTDWKSIFKSLRQNKKNVAVECEKPEVDSFTIGPIKRITETAVFIQHFSVVGILDERPSKIEFKDISKVLFGDRYIDIFSKYLKPRQKTGAKT